MSLYHSPRGLYPFQAKFAAYGAIRPSNLVAADAGLGKTHIAAASACVLMEDRAVDKVLFVVEGNKLDEWMADLATFTDLTAVKYHGVPGRRERLRGQGWPQAIVTTYQTARDDLAIKHPADSRSITPGPLMTSLRGERLLVVYDEMTLLGGAESGLHRVQRMFLDEHRERTAARVMGLTATPLTNGPLSYFNLGQILCPELLPSEREFHARYVKAYNGRGAPIKYKDLDLFAASMSGVLLRKRKTDPDVVALFPKPIEKFVEVTMSGPHYQAYQLLDSLVEELPVNHQVFAFNQLRAFACHPGWALRSTSKLAELLVEAMGADAIRKLKSRKSEQVIPYIRTIVNQGDSGIVFCDSVSALHGLSDDLTAAGIRHASYHGQISRAEREKVKAGFKAHEFPIMLASSAAERGVNLPEASYIINYDVPLLHSSYVQRCGRGSRIGSNIGGVVIIKTFITDATVEQGAVRLWNRRNDWSDQLVDSDGEMDENFTTALDRLHLIREAAKQKAA